MVAAIGRALTKQFNQTNSNYVSGVLAVTLSSLAIPLGSVSSPGWGFFYNSDPTDKINLRSNSGGADVVAILAGECAIFRWEPSQVPYAHSNSHTSQLEYVIFAS